MAIGNVLVGQSGGPTAVINSSLAGVYETAKACGAPHVYGMQYGIEGLLQGKLVDLDARLGDQMEIELLKRTPSSFLGSCRCKLPDPAADERPYQKLFALFAQYGIGAVFYIGGNDSMDTI
ncbi:MAG: 6-phosphofructokinase, partial [Gemmiger sp.]